MRKEMDPKKKLYLVMILSAVALVVMLIVGKYQQEKAIHKKTALSVTVKAAEVEDPSGAEKNGANVLETVQDLKAGKKLSGEQLDLKHVGKYFTSEKIRKGGCNLPADQREVLCEKSLCEAFRSSVSEDAPLQLQGRNPGRRNDRA